ncbi:hypothetical protein C068_01381 [Brucella sp. UK38/05]|nr:hypothetical protein C068_01381 [Brucella sp. UK38/05]ENT09652.1 hypothetical protein C001_01825 [Brucella sp. F5/06]
MIGNIALRHIRTEGQTLEIFGRHPRQFLPRIGLETKASVIAEVAKKNTAPCPGTAQLRKALADQLAANPLTLPGGQH